MKCYLLTAVKNTLDDFRRKEVSCTKNLENSTETAQNVPIVAIGGTAVRKKKTAKQDGKRRDSKGRILQKGESQRKGGTYQYRFTDRYNKRHYIYASELSELRRKEAEVQQQLALELNFDAGKLTVSEIVDRHLRMLRSMRQSTLETYATTAKIVKGTDFGKRLIQNIKVSDCREWCIFLSEEKYAFQTIQGIKKLMHSAFQMAVDDNLISKNPFHFKLNFLENDAEEKKALTAETEAALFEFMEGNQYFRQHCDIFRVLLGTGMRVSELCGLTRDDIDFNARIISVERQLQRSRNYDTYIAPPKTASGKRQIPMSDTVYSSLNRILADRVQVEDEPRLGKCSGFILLTKNGKLKTAANIEAALRRIIKSYNKTHAVPLPHIVPHTFRHTFCTRLMAMGVDLKSVQYLMGHANASTTLNIYTHADFDHVKEQFAKADVFRMPEALTQ